MIAGLRGGAVGIDFETSRLASARKLAEEMTAAGGAYLDAPPGRAPMHARDGLLNITGAGDESAFDRVRPVLDDLGENVFHLGRPGTVHVIELINNFCADARPTPSWRRSPWPTEPELIVRRIMMSCLQFPRGPA